MHTVAVRLLLSLLVTWLCCPGAVAQAPRPTQGGDDSPAAIQRQIDAAKADATIGEELKPILVEALEKALAAAKGLETFINSANTYAQERDAAPERLEAARAEISTLGATPEPTATPDASLRDLEGLLTQAQAEQTASSESVSTAERDATHRGERRAAIPGRLADVQRLLDNLPAEPALDASVDARLARARQQGQQLERKKLQAEQKSLEVEIASYEARAELLTARRDLASRKQQVARARAEFFANRVKDLSAREAARSAADARRAADEARQQHPLVAALADENVTIADQRSALVKAQTEVQSQLARIKTQKQGLGAQFDDIKARAQRAGATAAIGSLLRERRTHLADVDRLTRRAVGKGSDVADAYLAALDWEQRRRALVDDAGQLDRLLAEAEPPIPTGPAGDLLRKKARELLDDRLRTLETLASGWSAQLGNIEERDTAQVLLAELVAQYRTFINERVLWIRSSAPIWRISVQDVTHAATWVASPPAWSETLVTLSSLLTFEYPFSTLVGLLLLTLLAMRPRLLVRLREVGERASRGSNTLYGPTASALFYTLLLALPLPCLLLLAGVHVLVHPDCSEFSKAMGTGALSSAGMLGLVRGLRATVRQGGLAESHFQWSANTVSLFRRNLVLLLPAAFPLALLLGALESHGDDAWLGSLGRLLLVAFLALHLVFLWRTLHPVRGVLGNAPRNSLLYRGRMAWFFLAVSTPAALLVMALLGFDYTALQLSQRLTDTVILVLACALVHALILRGLLLARRRMLLDQMRKRMREAQAARPEGDEAEADGDEPDAEVALDPSSIALQTQAILRATVVIAALSIGYQIWIDVLPALGIFRQVPLGWDKSIDVPASLADLLAGLVITLVTILAARNLPGLLELLVLQRLKLPAGERHAVTTLARYVLIAVGTVVVFNVLGLGWSKVQWLVAGLSLGLGFGLQEIFANFVSGLILLLERPVRVGDIVVLGDLLGKVSRIRIRATTIRDLDNKELVVPNKEFVTGRFINWTLTDSMVRLRVNVGVAYGSDTRKARELLVRAATEAPRAAKSPKPKALFLGFGDSTLDLELRVYIEDYDEHADLLDDLHTRIDDLFRAHNIEIAFPQRDLHLRSAKPLVEFFERKELPVEDLS